MRIDGHQVAESATSTQNKDIESKFRVGDKIQAKVVEKSKDSLTLRMSDGTVFQASLRNGMATTLGDFLNFTVLQIDQRKVYLELQNNSQINLVSKELETLLQSLGLQDTSENKAILKEMLTQQLPITIKNFQDVQSTMKQTGMDMLRSVFFLANHIPTSESNIHQLTSYLEHTFNLETSLVSVEQKAIQTLPPEMQQQFFHNLKQTSIMQLQSLISEINSFLGKTEGLTSISASMSTDEISHIIQNILQSSAANSIKNSPKYKDLILQLESLFQIFTDTHVADSQKRIFHTGVALISSNLVASDLHMPTKYNDLLMRIHHLQQTLYDINLTPSHEIFSQLRNIEDNLQFLKEVNVNQTFVPIPIQVDRKNTTCELYVLKKEKNRKKIDPENATMFIALDMEKIGPIQALIHVQKKSISINLRLDNDSVIAHCKEEYKELYQMLRDIGYTITDIRYRILSDNVNLLNVNSLLEKEHDPKFNFDCKV